MGMGLHVYTKLTAAVIASIGLIAAFPNWNSSAQPSECRTVKDCAQDMVKLANQLKEENIALSNKLERLEERIANPRVFEVPGKTLERRCDDAWPNPIVAECPSNSVRIGGGCSFTCLGLDHTVSVPVTNGWSCAEISHDPSNATGGPNKGPRTFSTVAVCLRR